MLMFIPSAFRTAIWDWVHRPVFTLTVPAGRLPRLTAAFLSYLASHVLIPFGLATLGIWLTCWPQSWQALARPSGWIPVAGWLAAGLAAEKLAGIRVGRPLDPGQYRNLIGGARETAPFVVAVFVVAWPWPFAWWDAHQALRLVAAAGWSLGAVVMVVTSIRAALHDRAALSEPAGDAASGRSAGL
jgi:hypothetical protein